MTSKKGKIKCSYFLSEKGCVHGDKCKFLHSTKNSESSDEYENHESKKKICSYFTSSKGCFHGDNCEYAHIPKDVPTSDNRPCRFFKTTKGCIHGDSCEFAHAELNSNAVAKEKSSDEERLICSYFQSPKGCIHGDSCKFIHVKCRDLETNSDTKVTNKSISPQEVKKTKICSYFKSPKGCSKGDDCKFAHTSTDKAKNRNDRKVTYGDDNDDNEEKSHSKKVCRFFNTKAGCRRSDKCREVHLESPPPAPTTTATNPLPPPVGSSKEEQKRNVVDRPFASAAPISSTRRVVEAIASVSPKKAAVAPVRVNDPKAKADINTTSCPPPPGLFFDPSPNTDQDTGNNNKGVVNGKEVVNSGKKCKFFNGPTGCRVGGECKFAHIPKQTHEASNNVKSNDLPVTHAIENGGVKRQSNAVLDAKAEAEDVVPPFGSDSKPLQPLQPLTPKRKCMYYNSAKGCKNGDKCTFAHIPKAKEQEEEEDDEDDEDDDYDDDYTDDGSNGIEKIAKSLSAIPQQHAIAAPPPITRPQSHIPAPNPAPLPTVRIVRYPAPMVSPNTPPAVVPSTAVFGRVTDPSPTPSTSRIVNTFGSLQSAASAILQEVKKPPGKKVIQSSPVSVSPSAPVMSSSVSKAGSLPPPANSTSNSLGKSIKETSPVKEEVKKTELSTKPCIFYRKKTGCKNGDKCQYAHIDQNRQDKSVHFESSPIRICPYFHSEKGCLNGDKCKFSHTPLKANQNGNNSKDENDEDDDDDDSDYEDEGSNSDDDSYDSESYEDEDEDEDDNGDEDLSDDEEAKGEGKGKGKRQRACSYFQSARGCKNGDACLFAHLPVQNTHRSGVCKYFQSPKGCVHGDGCKYEHIRPSHSKKGSNQSSPSELREDDRITNLNTDGRSGANASSRSNQRPCSFFQSENGCRNGDNCKFLHVVDSKRIH